MAFQPSNSTFRLLPRCVTSLPIAFGLVSIAVCSIGLSPCFAEHHLPHSIRGDRPSAVAKPIPHVHDTYVYPVLGPRLSSEYGMRKHPIRRTRRHHHGVDLAAPVGAAIRAISGGQVIYADPFGGYGKFVVIRHANELTSHYGHCDSIAVNPGDTVKPGQIIAKVGNTGSSTGPHLHLEVRRNGVPLDPETVLPGLADPAEG